MENNHEKDSGRAQVSTISNKKKKHGVDQEFAPAESPESAELSLSYKRFNMKMGPDSHCRNLLVIDTTLLIIDYLQIFSLILSMSMRWPWPDTWTKAMSFMFLFNLDFWELSKRNFSPYVAARDNYIDSSSVPYSYLANIIIWYLVIISITAATFWIFKKLQKFRNNEKKLLKLKNGIIITLQVFSMPAGVQIAKLFWCLPYPENSVLDVDNSITCWSGGHVILVLIGISLLFVIFFLFPFFLWRNIHRQIISSEESKHETYLRLKHFENFSGIDTSWVDYNFIYFASFNRFWAFYRPISQVFKFFLICFYGVLFNSRLWQSSLLFLMFAVQLVVFGFLPPFRVTSLNFIVGWNSFCVICMLIIGLMQNINGIQNVFLIPSYIQVELILINLSWILTILLVLLYLYLRWKKILFKQAQFFPLLFKGEFSGIGEDNKRFVFISVSARELLTSVSEVPAILAPTHQLYHQINLIQKFSIEAEKQSNPLQSTLRSLLDEMIEVYDRYSDVSIFTLSNKNKVQMTSARLMKVLPAFTKRVYQRDFDLILVHPIKRRLLLKMFAVSCLLSPVSSRLKRYQNRALKRVWRRADEVLDEGFEEGFENTKFLEGSGLLSKEKYYDNPSYQSTSC